MKRKMILALMVLIPLGMNTILHAQSTTKKKKKKKTHHTAPAADTTSLPATVAPPDTMAKQPVAAAPQPPADAIDTSHMSDGLVADTSYLAYSNFVMDSSRPVDGYYKTPLLRGARPFPIPDINKYTITFYKRIWRVIDLSDSANRLLAIPGESLVSIIMDALKAQKIVAYADEGFKSRLSYEKVLKALSDSVIVTDLDSLTGDPIGSHAVFNPFNPDSITKLELKEDYYFDKVRGRMICQIISIAPIKKVKSSAGDVIGEQHPFYLYFPQCRIPFAGKEVYDTQRDVYGYSYDDLFMEGNYKTMIVKESNPSDLRIRDKYPNDEEKQKQEAQRVENELNNYKRGLWKY
jgi:gliding motility associated protien GldN